MIRLLIFFITSLALSQELLSQERELNISGQVSYIGSQNIYVRFLNTSGIEAGDTLFKTIGDTLVPALVVTNLSSSSCVCSPVSDVVIQIADFLIAKVNTVINTNKFNPEIIKKEEKVVSDSLEIIEKKPLSLQNKPRIRGSISAVSYSDFSNTNPENSQRFRYTLSLDARNISNSRFSAETYISFRHKQGEWDVVKENVFNGLKIYNLTTRYELNKSTQISFGRKINSKISNIGSMDGLQFEKNIKNISFGALAGTRPDNSNYSFNKDMFQYGAWMAFSTKENGLSSETSLAFMEQKNHSMTDRRFLYFQHSNSLIKNVFFFGTFETDLYTLSEGKPKGTFDLTGAYLSLRYRISKKLNVSGSYDARKNVMYYESYKSTIDTLFERELRQGFRLQANYRITRDILMGVQSGYRFLKTDPIPSKNIYTYLSYNQIPLLNLSVTLSGTYLESNYLNGKVLGLNLTKDLMSGKLQTGIGYRYLDYHLPESLVSIIQNVGETYLVWQINKKMSFSMNYEGTFEITDQFNRLYVQVRRRF